MDFDFSDEQLVSIDFNHNAHSSIVDTTFTRSVDPHMHKILAANLEQDKHIVFHAAGTEQARQTIASNQYDAILIDQKMPDGGGLDVLAAARDADPNVAVIFLTAEATAEPAMESMSRNWFSRSWIAPARRLWNESMCAKTTWRRPLSAK